MLLALAVTLLAGLSTCLGVDDSLFSYTLERGEKCKNGAVIIAVEVA